MRNKAVIAWLALALAVSSAPAQTAAIDDLLAKVAKWNYDDGREPLFALTGLLQKERGAEARKQFEARFIAFLKSDATLASKDFICRQLHSMGSEASVPVLSAMLLKSDTAEMARYALEGIPGKAVDEALRAALAKTSGKTQIGIINTLGVRRDAAAVPLLRPFALGQDEAAARAAWFALAQIADASAVQTLDSAAAKDNRAAPAYLQAASVLAARGNTAAALPIYKKLYSSGPAGLRAAALNGLAKAGVERSVLIQALGSSDARIQAIAISHLTQDELLSALPKLNEAGQVRVLGTLAYKGNAAAQPAFLTALKSQSKEVRLAALNGIGAVGNASAVPPLAEIAAGGDEAEQAAARAALGRLRGKDVDEAIVRAIPAAGEKVKLELIRAAGERGTAAATPVLLETARSGSNDARREALRALRETASASDIQALLALVLKPVQPADRSEAVRSLAGVLRRSDPARIEDVVTAYREGDLEARTALMQVMRHSGNPKALAVLRDALKEENADLKRAAILALGEWPDSTPIPDLMEIARTAANPAHQVLALRGALQLIRQHAAGRTPAETVKLLAQAMTLAKQADEKRTVLGLLPRFPGPDALKLARAYLNDSEVSAEAKAAVERLERGNRR
ncbi:MAG TPA: HEAT repeat domain-containing protein [Bryobacteraceae bacterium]|mgnify:CR=1 FL=1|nr:HEAT repeat domain-containing protein [Bryobacteraceae bacterium]HOQ45968.1 HEAT repeat domain-containing protein [Bryobacteraceae bacterium]HPU73821.1 HEAT repeat domain-containing protein [Bryobacteraceae bacterium]